MAQEFQKDPRWVEAMTDTNELLDELAFQKDPRWVEAFPVKNSRSGWRTVSEGPSLG